MVRNLIFLQLTERGDFEWTATVININPEYNKGIQKNCKALYDYISYVDRVKSNQKNNMNIKDAVDEAVNWAIKENLLEGFFKIHRAEVIGMCLTEIDEEEAKRIWHKDGFAEGKNEGRSEKAVEDATNMLKKKYPTSDISEITGLSLEQVLELQKQIRTLE